MITTYLKTEMCRLLFFKSCGGRGLEESSFSTYEDSIVESLLGCTVLFHYFYISLRFFFAEVFKAYSCIFLYIFENKLLYI